VDLELPNQWLWDIIDEFIYQFQAFCQYRSKVKAKSETELSLLRERPDVGCDPTDSLDSFGLLTLVSSF
jgi:translation initiation factor 3 subunit L